MVDWELRVASSIWEPVFARRSGLRRGKELRVRQGFGGPSSLPPSLYFDAPSRARPRANILHRLRGAHNAPAAFVVLRHAEAGVAAP